MRYKKFGKTGLEVSEICLGTWGIGGAGWDAHSDEERMDAIKAALDCGINFIDTAPAYNAGRAEQYIGETLHCLGARKHVILTTKCGNKYVDGKYIRCGSEALIRRQCEESLRNLQTDYIDLLLIHEPYDSALEMYEAMKEAYRAGKVRAIGISNFNEKKYQAFVAACDIVPAVSQVESHVYYPQLALQKEMEKHGTQMQSWASFTEGRKNIFAEPLLQELGNKYGKTSAQIALRYLVQNKIAVIPKSVHQERMKQNLAVFDFEISQEDMKKIEKLDGGKTLFGWY